MMKEIAISLQNTLEKAMPLLSQIAENETTISSEGKWSKKEIIGHLIDSACNNQQKFVRTMAQPHLDFVGYAQNYWVEVQAYNSYEWRELLTVWKAYNIHIAHIIANVKTETLQNTISIDGKGLFTLAFIMEDYVEHLKHHLAQILPQVEWGSTFDNVYH
jgi:hypothetical protein